MLFRSVACALLITFAGLTTSCHARGRQQSDKPLASPAATASATLGSTSINITYNAPSMRGRPIMGKLVPYGRVWRTGANPATTITTSSDLMFGTLLVPAGTHTLYSYPSEDQWLLIVNKQTGQWGTDYSINEDLGRVPMMSKPITSPQEVMSISFENTTPTSTELHVRWEKTDEFVKITTK